jgi:hypothetical protein
VNNEEKILSLLETLSTTVVQIQSDVSSIKQEQAIMKQDQEIMKAKLDQINTYVIKIENNHELTINALGDGFTSLRNITDKIIADVAEIKSRQERQDLQIKALDAKRKFG